MVREREKEKGPDGSQKEGDRGKGRRGGPLPLGKKEKDKMLTWRGELLPLGSSLEREARKRLFLIFGERRKKEARSLLRVT